MQARFKYQAAIPACRRASLSQGSLRIMCLVSSSIPKKLRHVVGPSVLCSCNGTTSTKQISCVFSSSAVHSDSLALTSKKSFK